eukprot:3131278-Pleurochrysis_carterae.AAC.1
MHSAPQSDTSEYEQAAGAHAKSLSLGGGAGGGEGGAGGFGGGGAGGSGGGEGGKLEWLVERGSERCGEAVWIDDGFYDPPLYPSRKIHQLHVGHEVARSTQLSRLRSRWRPCGGIRSVDAQLEAPVGRAAVKRDLNRFGCHIGGDVERSEAQLVLCRDTDARCRAAGRLANVGGGEGTADAEVAGFNFTVGAAAVATDRVVVIAAKCAERKSVLESVREELRKRRREGQRVRENENMCGWGLMCGWERI